MGLAEEAGRVADHVREALDMETPGRGPASTAAMADAAAAFAFPDAVWVRVIYDLVITARDQPEQLEAYVTSLVPVYFGRVASSFIENRDLSTDRAEESIERQAREFERLKPYLVNRWGAA
jgi:flagellar biosynthesis regulator FlaF